MIYFLSCMALSMLIGAIIGAFKGNIGAGLGWGILGPIGWLITFLSDDKREKCPKCGSAVNENAFVCKSCGNRLVLTHSDYKKRSLDPMANWKDTTHQEVEESDDTPSPVQSQEDPVKKLKQLKDMQDGGLITAEEYEAKRQAILSRM